MLDKHALALMDVVRQKKRGMHLDSGSPVTRADHEFHRLLVVSKRLYYRCVSECRTARSGQLCVSLESNLLKLRFHFMYDN